MVSDSASRLPPSTSSASTKSIVQSGPEWSETDYADQLLADSAYRGPELRAWQKEALGVWARSGHRGIVEAITGTGKSLVGVAAIYQTVVLHGGKALVLVPTRALLDQWLQIVRKYLPTAQVGALTAGSTASFHRVDVIVSTVQTAHKHPPVPTSLGVVVADEVHRYGTSVYSGALHAKYERRLGLSGTLDRTRDNGVAQYLRPYFGDSTFHYGYADALRDGVVAPFNLALVGVGFDRAEQRQYDNAHERGREAKSVLVRRYGYDPDPATFFTQASEGAKTNRGWSDEGQLCARYLSAFADRRRITAEAVAKRKLVGLLSQQIESLNGTLVFTETKESAARLAETINSATSAFALTGDSSSRIRSEKLGQFGRGRLKALCTPRILDEGIDVPEAEFALVVAASQTARQMIQRMGRVIRLKQDGRAARIMILYVRGTDEDPNVEGHVGFLSEVRPHARSVEMLDGSDPQQALDWLD